MVPVLCIGRFFLIHEPTQFVVIAFKSLDDLSKTSCHILENVNSDITRIVITHGLIPDLKYTHILFQNQIGKSAMERRHLFSEDYFYHCQKKNNAL